MESATSQTHEPRTNKRSSSGVIARLMGLESLTAAIDESTTLKTRSLGQESVSNSKLRKEEGLKRGVGHVITRIPLETAPWKQEGSNRSSQKPPFKSKEDPENFAPASPSIYSAIEKRLIEHEFKSSGKENRIAMAAITHPFNSPTVTFRIPTRPCYRYTRNPKLIITASSTSNKPISGRRLIAAVIGGGLAGSKGVKFSTLTSGVKFSTLTSGHELNRKASPFLKRL